MKDCFMMKMVPNWYNPNVMIFPALKRNKIIYQGKLVGLTTWPPSTLATAYGLFQDFWSKPNANTESNVRWSVVGWSFGTCFGLCFDTCTGIQRLVLWRLCRLQCHGAASVAPQVPLGDPISSGPAKSLNPSEVEVQYRSGCRTATEHLDTGDHRFLVPYRYCDPCTRHHTGSQPSKPESLEKACI
jgi:hypothetical protein